MVPALIVVGDYTPRNRYCRIQYNEVLQVLKVIEAVCSCRSGPASVALSIRTKTTGSRVVSAKQHRDEIAKSHLQAK